MYFSEAQRGFRGTHCEGRCLRLSTHTRDTQRSHQLGLSDDTLLEKGTFREARIMSFNLSEQRHIWIKT